jgi:hypothetical protein
MLRFLISLPVLSQMAETDISKGASLPLATPLAKSMLMSNVRVHRVLQLVKVTEYSAGKRCQESSLSVLVICRTAKMRPCQYKIVLYIYY